MVPSSILNDIHGLKMGGINESKKKKNKNEAYIQKTRFNPKQTN